MMGTVMARPKGRPRKPEADAKTVGIRATAAWADWLDELARHYRTTASGVVDRALTEWAEAQGYPVKPPPRTP